MTELIGMVILVALFGLSFSISLTETALFALNGPLVARFREIRSTRVSTVLRFLKFSQETLTALTFLNTLANFAIAFLSLWMILRHELDPFYWILLALLGIIVGCEIFPKTLAMRHPEVWSLRMTPILWPLMPLVKLFCFFSSKGPSFQSVQTDELSQERPSPTKLSIEEYKEVLELACQQGAMSSSEKNFIIQIISLDCHIAKDVMKLRSQVAYIPSTATLPEMIAAARKYKHRRLPLYNEETNDVTGILNTKELLMSQDFANMPDDALDIPPCVPDSMNLLQLLKSFQRYEPGLIVVLDEFGESSGIITMEDILEEVVGDIRSESEDQGPMIQQEGNFTWKVNGSLLLEDLLIECPEIKAPAFIQTVAGLILNQLEIVPLVNQSVSYCGYTFTVLSVEFAKIREVRITKQTPSPRARSYQASKTI